MVSFLALLVVGLVYVLEEGSPRMGDVRVDHPVLEGSEQGFATTKFDALLNWAKKYSLFQYPFVTACCGMEFMSFAAHASTWRASAPRPPLLAAPEPTCSGWWAPSASARPRCCAASTSR
jgi:hypothetical protein